MRGRSTPPLPPPEAAPVDEAPREVGPSPDAPKNRPSARLAVGGGYGRLFDVRMVGPEVSLSGGVEASRGPGRAPVAVVGTLTGERATSPNGLTAYNARGLATIELVLGRARLGAGIHVQYFALARKSGIFDARTDDGAVITRLGVGAHLSASVDVVEIDRSAIYLSVTPELTYPLPLSNVSGAIGFRL